MRRDITNYQLMLIRDDMKNLSPAMQLLLAPKIEQFFQKNKNVLTILNDKTTAIKKKYAKLDESGNFVVEEINGKKEVTYETEEARKACTEELTAFLNITIKVEL